MKIYCLAIPVANSNERYRLYLKCDKCPTRAQIKKVLQKRAKRNEEKKYTYLENLPARALETINEIKNWNQNWDYAMCAGFIYGIALNWEKIEVGKVE